MEPLVDRVDGCVERRCNLNGDTVLWVFFGNRLEAVLEDAPEEMWPYILQSTIDRTFYPGANNGPQAHG